MKILCIYHDPEDSWSSPDPRDILEGHEVTCAETYVEALELIHDESRGIPSFHIVLSDVCFPRIQGEEAEVRGPLLSRFITEGLIRGFGMFVREDSTEAFVGVVSGLSIQIGSSTCWTPAGHRDWEKLLNMILFRINLEDSKD